MATDPGRQQVQGLKRHFDPTPGIVAEMFGACECGHPIAEHAESGWGEHSVCVEPMADENVGWYGVCPCVRRGPGEAER